MKQFFQKNGHWIVLALIIAAACFVRIYNFNDWLYFKGDQARDARNVMQAYENGPGDLPLLGPKAGGTYLRLGPAFYYIEYLSAVVFGSTEPYVMAYPVLLFAILSIGVFYLLVKDYFSKKMALMVTALFAFSFVMVEYSRFAWNPNPLPFWSLLFVLGLLKSVTTENKNKAGLWLVAVFFSYGIISQLHFVALLGFPVVAALFWALYLPKKISWKYWAAAFGVLFVIYLPMIVSDLATNGNNLLNFKYALTHKSEPRPITESLDKASELTGRYYTLMLTSFYLKKNVYVKVITWALVALSLGLMGLSWKKNAKENIRPFIAVVFIWFVVYMGIYVKLAAEIDEPRFWLMTAAVPFIFLAFLFSNFETKKGLDVLPYFIVVVLLGVNAYGLSRWYLGMERTESREAYLEELKLKQDDGIGLSDIQKVADYMYIQASAEDKGVCFRADTDYESAIQYVYETKNQMAKRLDVGDDSSDYCQFFIVDEDFNTADKLDKSTKEAFDIFDPVEIGPFKIWQMQRKNSLANGPKSKEEIRKYFVDQDEKNEVNIFDEFDEQVVDENGKPVKIDRIYWKDVFGYFGGK